MIGRIFREPLVQFVLLGALVFVVHGMWSARSAGADRTIVVTTDDMTRMATILAAEQGRVPNESDMRGLLAAHVREEALYREAVSLGLGEDDTIVRRRLAQKMQFMIEDVAQPPEPDEATLRAWFDENAQDFATAEKRRFTHVFFSPERRGETVEAEALAALEVLQDSDDWQSVGDPFMLQRAYGSTDAEEVARLFGTSFARALFALEGSDWSGPIGSAFGVHLVRVDGRTEGTVPAFQDVADDVRAAWLDEARRAANEQRVSDLIDRYDVVLEASDD